MRNPGFTTCLDFSSGSIKAYCLRLPVSCTLGRPANLWNPSWTSRVSTASLSSLLFNHEKIFKSSHPWALQNLTILSCFTVIYELMNVSLLSSFVRWQVSEDKEVSLNAKKNLRLAPLKRHELIMKHCLKLVFCTAAAARLMEYKKRTRQLRSMDIYIYVV